ncbi:MAG: UDP-N-acetylmuramoyl-L-alanyl-D-glutamate--2,6-diaminopimelate ligase [Bacteroidota bacterium]
MLISKLTQDLPATNIQMPDEELSITSVVFDSRKVVPGSLFVAIKGSQVDGHDFLGNAVESGAVALVAEHFPDGFNASNNLCLIVVPNGAEALGMLATNWYDHPSKKLRLVGVTGTNGKTTVATLLHDAFTHLGYDAGLLSTVEIRIGHKKQAATHTTPDAMAINQALAEMVDQGVTHAFMEVSSHATHQRRIAGLKFDGGVFTNMSHDHLDYHGTFRAYIEAKKMFFDTLPASAFALVNIDDKRGAVMVQNTAARVYRYSLRSMADYRARLLDDNPMGLHLEIDGQEVFTRLLGRFNAYNLLAVYGVARLLEENQMDSLTALSQLQAPAGRMQYVFDPKGERTAVVDYAHTPDALKKVLETLLQSLPQTSQLICVVGAGGDRDRTKRPEMARIGARLASQLILTSDNPRTENPESILDDMMTGLDTPDLLARTARITDRKTAIESALALANPGDLVLVAGKGHETYQEINGERLPFDDREVIRDFFDNHTKRT